ncbi:MAG: hypothetical protein CSA20_05305 [Deltaproteobacteria bacterium]|nr:MAG: hypothetical protein CSA20_05305 [Deltaproteobacteria bacterium]
MALSKKKKFWLQNTLFLLTLLAILLFLLRAPEETTPFLPHDPVHEPFHQIKSKRQAEKGCNVCHSPTGESPLGENHPPKYRCLFCHKRVSE